MCGYRTLICVGLASILVCLLPLWAGQEAPVLKVGDKAPQFNAKDRDRFSQGTDIKSGPVKQCDICLFCN